MATAQPTEKKLVDRAEELSGVLMFARVHTPNQFGKFQVDLILDEEDQFNKAEKFGLKIRREPTRYDNQPFVTITRKEINAKGERIPGIPVVDASGKELRVDIGNGSRGIVKFLNLPYSNKFGMGNAARLLEIKVTDFKPYEKI